MNNSDMKIAQAVSDGTPIKINDKEVVGLYEQKMKVILCGNACIVIDREKGHIAIDGMTPATRKSTRLINAILSRYGNFKVFCRKGAWYFEDENHQYTEFSDKILTINLK